MKPQQKNNNPSEEIKNLMEFSIELSSGHQNDTIYANGNMQAGVRINIKANSAGGHIIHLSDEQLNSIELINYVTSEKLVGKWSYSSVENYYNHTFRPPYSTPDDKDFSSSYKSIKDDKLDNDPDIQKKSYWITTTEVAPIKIAAQITLDGITYATNQGYFDSSADINGYSPIVYHARNLMIPPSEKTNSGIYDVTVITKEYDTEIERHTEHYNWEQYNYYVRPKPDVGGFKVKSVEIADTYNDTEVNDNDYHGFTHRTESQNLHLCFLWGTEKIEKRKAGNQTREKKYSRPDFYDSKTYIATPEVEILTTPNNDTISISRLYFQSPEEGFWEDFSNNKPKFKFIDEYGNQSNQIKIEMEDYQSFYLEDWKY
ncbi:hypothetical protein [Xenorhabdus stockiae]|uniref:hypothetical protein n=1 Tax=Xenorhabdus stockiae TaxID=351614 RepID=UPI004063BB91